MMVPVETVGNVWMWLGFTAGVAVLIAVDLLLFSGRGGRAVSVRQALAWSAVWMLLALGFTAWLWWYLDGSLGRVVANDKALEFLTGYLIEKSLAMDNIFVFVMIFGYFAVPAALQARVLVYGVLGAIVLRAVMILAGVWLIAKFHWVLYLFGLFLLVTGIKMLMFAERKPDLARNPLLRWMRGHLRITDDYQGTRFFVQRDGLRYATPLFLVLVLIEFSDLIFALDSIPAIFAVTNDPFIVFTSNIFAILGLRALYFVLADMADRFHLLKYGLAMVLVFIGVKMLVAGWYPIPVAIALGVVAVLIASSIIASLALRPPAGQ